MYIFKNAFISIMRNKGRNILIGIIVMVIATAVTINLAISSSAKTIMEAYYESNPLIASLSMNREKVMEQFIGGEDKKEENIEKFNDIPIITVDEIVGYGNSEYLDSYYYTNTISLNGSDITKASDSVSKEVTDKQTTTSKKTGGGNKNGRFPGGPDGGMWTETNTTTIITKSIEIFQNSRIQTGDFSLVGYSSYDAMTEFMDGTYKIASGTVLTDFSKYECVINQELATLNELEVGSELTLINSNNKKKYKFTVKGIFEEDVANTDMKNMYSNSANMILVSSDIVTEIMSEDDELMSSVSPSFILKNEEVIDKFMAEVSEKGLNEYYTVTTNLETIQEETKSINNVGVFANTFMIITLIIGTVVLLVINMINVRERKYEIGVLRTIGMKKILVISQFVFELLIVSASSLLIGGAIGACLSVDTANYLLANEIESTNESRENIRENFGGINFERPDNNQVDKSDNETDSSLNEKKTNIVDEEKITEKVEPLNDLKGIRNVSGITEINAVVDIVVILKLLGIGLMITLVSSLSAMISIARFSPLTILKERS